MISMVYDDPITKQSVCDSRGQISQEELTRIKCHEKLSAFLARLQEGPWPEAYEAINGIICQYDHSISDLPEGIQILYMDYTDLLEGVLSAQKVRNTPFDSLVQVFRILKDLYVIIYNTITSLSNDVTARAVKTLEEKEELFKKLGILPTIKEYEILISEIYNNLTKEEKEDLDNLLAGHFNH